MMQKVYMNYTTSDAAGNNYEQAANYFFNEKAAMIANGPWMIGDFTDLSKVNEGFNAKIKAAAFPGSGIFEEIDFGYVCASSTSEKQEAATALIKLMTDNYGQMLRFDLLNASPVSKTIEIPDELKAAKPLFMSLVDVARGAEYRFQTLGRCYDPLVSQAATNAFPALALGQIKPIDFGNALADEQRKLN
jgi:raffinose/stachyose/melibiose transport system substrate-binding protein